MSKVDTHRVTNRWLRYAQEDLNAARLYTDHQSMAPRHACFLAQQSAEKALKAILVFTGNTFPYRHDLEFLLALLPDDCELKHNHPDLSMLTGWAVEARYPTDLPDPTTEDAEDAVDKAAAVIEAAREDLTSRGLLLD